MELVFADVFLKAFLMCGILYMIARHEADLEFPKVAMVTAVITGGTMFLEALLLEKISVLTYIPAIAFFMFMVMKFCWLPFWKALLAGAMFYSINFGIKFGLLVLIAASMMGREPATETIMNQHESDLAEGLQIYQEMMEYNAEQAMVPDNDMIYNTPEDMQAEIAEMMALVEAEQAKAEAAAANARRQAEEAMGEAEQPKPPPRAAPRRAKRKPVPDEDPLLASKKLLRLQGVMSGKGGKRIALVNDDMVEVGGITEVTYRGTTYRWKLVKLDGDRPTWEPVD